MKHTSWIASCTLLLTCSSWLWAAEGAIDTARIESLTGLKGQLNEKEQVFKVSYPRGDIVTSINGVKMTPPLGLTAWAAFTPMADHLVVMGDMVMTEDQVNPVMSVALDNGLEVTALHNHFFWDSPKVMFMHIGGTGPQDALAGAVGKVFAKIKETSGGRGQTVKADIDTAASSISAAPLDAIFGQKGDLAKGIYKLTVGRTTAMHGQQMGNAMGVNTWAAFAGADDKAVVDGDFAMTEGELQGVLKALRAANINIVAIHNHMTMEQPRIMFLHFWAVGPAQDLAKGVKAALDTQKN
jgi:hypothetical protein